MQHAVLQDMHATKALGAAFGWTSADEFGYVAALSQSGRAELTRARARARARAGARVWVRIRVWVRVSRAQPERPR